MGLGREHRGDCSMKWAFVCAAVDEDTGILMPWYVLQHLSCIEAVRWWREEEGVE